VRRQHLLLVELNELDLLEGQIAEDGADRLRHDLAPRRSGLL
jgi:hypothetical protein